MFPYKFLSRNDLATYARETLQEFFGCNFTSWCSHRECSSIPIQIRIQTNRYNHDNTGQKLNSQDFQMANTAHTGKFAVDVLVVQTKHMPWQRIFQIIIWSTSLVSNIQSLWVLSETIALVRFPSYSGRTENSKYFLKVKWW